MFPDAVSNSNSHMMHNKWLPFFFLLSFSERFFIFLNTFLNMNIAVSFQNSVLKNIHIHFLCFVDLHSCIFLFKWSQLGAHYFLVIYFNFSTCVRELCAHHQENLLYLCDTGIFHSVWVAVSSADQTATHTEWKIPVSPRYSKLSWRWAHGCPKHAENLK